MRRVVAGVMFGVLIAGAAIGGPIALADDWRSDVLRAAASGVGPAGYEDDEDYFLWYVDRGSTSSCGGNPACDIDYTSYAVSRDLPDYVLIIVGMAGETDSEMSNNEFGGVFVDIDVDGDPSTREYSAVTRWQSYPLGEFIASSLQEWNGEKWVLTDMTVDFQRAEGYWGVVVPWREIGIEQAAFSISAADAADNSDESPVSGSTPYLPIAAMVAGAPGQPRELTAEPGPGRVTLSWDAPRSTGASEITEYRVTAVPDGASCVSATTSCSVEGLTAGKSYSFTVTAANTQGVGPASDSVRAIPRVAGLTAPDITKVSYKKNGKKATATVAWHRVVGASEYEVRVGLNGKGLTLWRSVKGPRISIAGLLRDKRTRIEIRAVDSAGPGPTTKEIIGWGPSFGM